MKERYHPNLEGMEGIVDPFNDGPLLPKKLFVTSEIGMFFLRTKKLITNFQILFSGDPLKPIPPRSRPRTKSVGSSAGKKPNPSGSIRRLSVGGGKNSKKINKNF